MAVQASKNNRDYGNILPLRIEQVISKIGLHVERLKIHDWSRMRTLPSPQNDSSGCPSTIKFRPEGTRDKLPCQTCDHAMRSPDSRPTINSYQYDAGSISLSHSNIDFSRPSINGARISSQKHGSLYLAFTLGFVDCCTIHIRFRCRL